jgi:tetratricopeptide (TPR) repeat protein
MCRLGKKPLYLILLYTLVSINLFLFPVYSQDTTKKPSRQSSLEAFSKGNYEKAYDEFSQLLLIYPKDPLYNYYSAVCLIKLNRNPDEAVLLLQQAIKTNDVVKSLPQDALFYLGRAMQMSGRFGEAIESYNQYSTSIGRKASKEQGIAQYIQQCNEKKGAFSENETIKTNSRKPTLGDTSLVSLRNTENLVKKTNEQDSTKRIYVPDEINKIINEGLNYQYKADSVNTYLISQKNNIDQLSYIERQARRADISKLDSIAIDYQKLADDRYNEVQHEIYPVAIDSQQNEKLKQDSVTDDSFRPKEEKKVVPDSTRLTSLHIQGSTDNKADTVNGTPAEVSSIREVYFLFELLDKSATDTTVSIQINPSVPQGLVYRIQLAVFRNPVPSSFFKGISPVYGFSIPGGEKTNYYAGMFRRYQDAGKALVQIKSKGFKDAFIVAFSDGNQISAERASVIEKEWSSKPFNTINKVQLSASSDTVPPTLSFRVEVTRTVKPLKEDVVANLRKIAANKGLDSQILEDKRIVYLIGKFINFDSAAEFADLLVRNGYNEAKVVAWLGKKEIPLETAKKLFETLE